MAEQGRCGQRAVTSTANFNRDKRCWDNWDVWLSVTAIVATMPDEAPKSDETQEAPPATESKVSREPQRIASPPLPRWIAPAALLVAVVAVALAIWALMSGGNGSASAVAPTAGTEGGDPKASVCGAFNTVSKAIPLQTHNDLGPDPVAQAAVAGNARLALFGGGQYLLNHLNSDTPSDIADPVRSFGTKLQTIGMNALAGVTNTDPAQAALLADADASRQQVVEVCK
jgi:hypothetical protein